MIEPFEVYKLYLALKLHFTKKDYNITKTKGAVRVKHETFLKRKDLTAIRKLARDYSRKEIIDFLVANFVSGEKWGGLFDIHSKKRYDDWLSRKGKRDYIFEQDVAKIQLEMEKREISSPFFSESGKHPLTFQLYFANIISIETLVILDKVFNLAMNEDDIFLGECIHLVKKYRPFVKVTDKMKIVANVLKPV